MPFVFETNRKSGEREKNEREPAASLPSPIQKFVIQRLDVRDGEIDWSAGSRWVENLFRRVFRMRTVTEHDLRAENRGTGEKLLVVGGRSANMWLTRSSGVHGGPRFHPPV